MSSIPNAKMKHAQVHGDDDSAAGGGGTPKSEPKKGKAARESLTDRARELGGRVEDLAEDAVDAVKSRPKTAAAIGAGLVAGAAALVGVATGAFKSDDKKTPAKKAAAPKKPAAKKKG